jgi:hypothetical protein
VVVKHKTAGNGNVGWVRKDTIKRSNFGGFDRFLLWDICGVALLFRSFSKQNPQYKKSDNA